MNTSLPKIITIVVAIVSISFATNAQTTVKSLSSEKIYTDKQIKSILGTPNRLDIQKSDDGNTLCNYYYQDARFSFCNGQLIGMYTKTKKYPVMTDKISGGVKVGDNISKVLKIKGISYSQLDDDKNYYLISFTQCNEPDYCIRTKNNLITDIGYTLFD